MKNEISLQSGLRAIITYSVIGTFLVQIIISLIVAQQFPLTLLFMLPLYLCIKRNYETVVMLNGLYSVDLKGVIDEKAIDLESEKEVAKLFRDSPKSKKIPVKFK